MLNYNKLKVQARSGRRLCATNKYRKVNANLNFYKTNIFEEKGWELDEHSPDTLDARIRVADHNDLMKQKKT